jgi:acyl-CoA thioesterase YciA
MWAYTDEESDYLSSFRPSPAARPAVRSTRAVTKPRRLSDLLPNWLTSWAQRRAHSRELHRLDARSMADLGINAGDFPAILSGSFTRGGESSLVGRDSAIPRGQLASRTLAMPADANPHGAIFGGWVMAAMDAAGAMTATRLVDGRVVTVAVSHITFLNPLQVGDSVCCYTDVVRTGRTSLTLNVEVWVLRQGRGDRIKVTQAEFTFVAVDAAGKPRKLVLADRAMAMPMPA